MECFPDLKCLYFECNGCRAMTGLETNSKLKSLFLQENLITKIEGLSNHPSLAVLNLTKNLILKIDDLDKCTSLDSLYMANNRLGLQIGEGGCSSLESLVGLLKVPSLTSLDIQNNYLDDPAILDEVFAKMKNLAVLSCKGNDFIKKIPNYRKTMIAKIRSLEYLDDRPVFPEERRRAEAFAAGALKAEREEMKVLQKEKE